MPSKNKLRRQKKKAKAVATQQESISDSMRTHIQGMGFTIAEYKQWCKENGFKTTLNKTYNDIHRERLELARVKADAVSKERRKVRSPKRALASFLAGDERAGRYIPYAIRNALESNTYKRQEDCDALHRLIQHVNKHTDLLNDVQSPWQRATYTTGIIALAKWHTDWIRPVEDWRPKTHNTRRRFSSLARHLFAKYDVPLFMDECWFVRPDERQLWFLQIGNGVNPRHFLEMTDDAHYPVTRVKFTKKEAHYFLQAPVGYSISHAMRYGQVLAMGGEPGLAEVLGETRLADNWQNNEFWSSVLRYFVQNPMLDRAQFGPIVDYIQYQRFTPRREMVERGVWVDRDPPQPNFSMHRRDPEALLRVVEEWHAGLGRRHRRGNMDWMPSTTIQPFELSMGEGNNHRVWRIDELLSTQELRDEGSELGHCVASYDQSCAAGRCSIWSMRCMGSGRDYKKTRLTIEVAGGNIRQARGRHNAMATEQQKKILNQWAGNNGLNISTYVFG